MLDRTEFDKLCTLAASIAQHMPGWVAEIPSVGDEEYPPRHVYLGRADGAGMGLAWVWNQPVRIEVSGRYPVDVSHYRERYLSIRFAPDRPPANLAREITRRFLPAYLACWEEAQARLISLRQAEARVTCTAEACAQAVGRALQQIRYDSPRTSATLYTSVGTITVEYAGTVQLQSASLSPTLAVEILTRLMEATAK